jgi:hypothetical protein
MSFPPAKEKRLDSRMRKTKNMTCEGGWSGGVGWQGGEQWGGEDEGEEVEASHLSTLIHTSSIPTISTPPLTALTWEGRCQASGTAPSTKHHRQAGRCSHSDWSPSTWEEGRNE